MSLDALRSGQSQGKQKPSRFVFILLTLHQERKDPCQSSLLLTREGTSWQFIPPFHDS